MEAITGVFSGNSVSEGFWDAEDIDLAYEEHCEECSEEYHDQCFPDSGDTHLIGDWRKVKGEYQPNKSGAEGFAAIFNANVNTIQVVWSKTKIRCFRCSPCYPGQGDADTDGNLVAYALPFDCLHDEWLKENAHRMAYRGKRLSWEKIEQLREEERAGWDIVSLWIDADDKVRGQRRNGEVFVSPYTGKEGLQQMREFHPQAEALDTPPTK